MTGRLSKLQDKFNADTANIQNDIAMRKADVETQLNLQTKQFDINSQQAQQSFNQFNSLLSSGALDNASGEDIANIVRATGISSSMIQSAIGVSKAKNAPKVNTQVIQVDDGTNVSAVVINQDTDEVIKRALDAGVSIIVNTGTSIPSSRQAVELAQKYSQLYAIVGIHPHHADKADKEFEGEIQSDWLGKLEELAKSPKVIGIGEVGRGGGW